MNKQPIDDNDIGEIPAFVILAGYIATLAFTVQYLPQIFLNYKRRSVKGFSTIGILIKLIGAAYLCVNSWLNGEELPVILYGALNVAQHFIFLTQFTLYTGNRRYLIFFAVPLLPYFTGILMPETTIITNTIKPLSQFFSHVVQLHETWSKKSSEGVSLLSQHLNLIGGLLGIFMYTYIPPKSFFTYMVYYNSIFQAASLYALAVYFDGWAPIINSLQIQSTSLDDITSIDTEHHKSKDIESL